MSRHVQIRVVLCLLVIVLEFTAEAQPKPTCRNDQSTLSPCSPEAAEAREDITKQGGPMSDCEQYFPTEQPFLEPFSFIFCWFFTIIYSG